MIQGADWRAFLKISLIAFSDSPTHLLITSGPLILMKFASLSVAIAFAKRVLPVPGGPNNRIPFGGSTPASSKTSGYISGHSTASLNS